MDDGATFPAIGSVEPLDDTGGNVGEISQCASHRHVAVMPGFAEGYEEGRVYLALNCFSGQKGQEGFTIGANPEFAGKDDVVALNAGERHMRGT